MMMRILLAAGFLAVLGGVGFAQPVYQQNSVMYCATGQYDGQNNPVVAPCGFAGNPTAVVVTPSVGAQQIQPVTQCPANPLSKKVPPLC